VLWGVSGTLAYLANITPFFKANANINTINLTVPIWFQNQFIIFWHSFHCAKLIEAASQFRILAPTYRWVL
jgi:hypothetical protein